MCGENLKFTTLPCEFKGSPPRVRGKLDDLAAELGKEGITPACAGKTTLRERRSMRPRDHPRVCGENSIQCFPRWQKMGSPPRVRGKLYERRQEKRYSGITPACAGKTKRRTASARMAGDHPRVCGENFRSPCVEVKLLGSPPRVRGKR